MKNCAILNGKMPPKRKDPQYSEKPIAEVQADHELFLQAFEKPTQIYRYLRTRNILSPVFLHRSLYYMKNRMSRNHKNRSSFKIDSLIEKVEKNELQSNHPGSFLNLSFVGFFDKRVEGEGELARLEVHIVKMCHKKRKEASAPITQACVGTHDICINPTAGALITSAIPLSPHHSSNGTQNTSATTLKEPLVTIPTQTFGGNNGHQVKSYLLLFKVDLVHDQENVCEPASKRRRLSRGGSCVGGGSSGGGGDVSDNTENVSCGVSSYRAELIVYDRHGRCQLTPGTYDLVLQPMPNPVSMNPGTPTKIMGSSPRKSASWETAEDLKVETANFSNFQSCGPTLQFRLTWSHGSGVMLNSASNAMQLSSGATTAMHVSNLSISHTVDHNSNNGAFLKPIIRPKQPLSLILTNNVATKPKPQGVCSPEAPQLVLYQFVYNNNGRQQTEARRDFHCPWCSINCLALYCLLKHLKLCHARFTFTYVPHPKGARIDVALNDCYDGSYAGNPQDLVRLSGGGGGGTLYSRAGPARRAPTTSLLVCRPRRSKPSLSEFLEQDNADFDLPRSYILGHNRLYHHTMSCRPIGAHELDEDSEGEHDSIWMRTKTVSMIDDFSDVNEGEKEIMKLWNVHVMRHNTVSVRSFVGDCQISKACAMFVENHGEELLRRNLYRNYTLHLVSLYEFGVIGAGVVHSNIKQLQAMLKDKADLREEVRAHWNLQRKEAARAFPTPRPGGTTGDSSSSVTKPTNLAVRCLLGSAVTAKSLLNSSTSLNLPAPASAKALFTSTTNSTSTTNASPLSLFSSPLLTKTTTTVSNGPKTPPPFSSSNSDVNTDNPTTPSSTCTKATVNSMPPTKNLSSSTTNTSCVNNKSVVTSNTSPNDSGSNNNHNSGIKVQTTLSSSKASSLPAAGLVTKSSSCSHSTTLSNPSSNSRSTTPRSSGPPSSTPKSTTSVQQASNNTSSDNNIADNSSTDSNSKSVTSTNTAAKATNSSKTTPKSVHTAPKSASVTPKINGSGKQANIFNKSGVLVPKLSNSSTSLTKTNNTISKPQIPTSGSKTVPSVSVSKNGMPNSSSSKSTISSSSLKSTPTMSSRVIPSSHSKNSSIITNYKNNPTVSIAKNNPSVTLSKNSSISVSKISASGSGSKVTHGSAAKNHSTAVASAKASSPALRQAQSSSSGEHKHSLSKTKSLASRGSSSRSSL